MKLSDLLIAFVVAFALVLGIDLITNSLDIVRYTWDFRYYINLTNNGFDPNPLLISPFAYRYPTPFMAGGFMSLFGVDLETGYRMVAYCGAVLQLFGIYLICFHFFKRKDLAYAGMLLVAFTFMNIKFLLFDVYRPDHMAYALVTLSVFFALTHRYYLLLITACVAVQFREFGILPLFSYGLFLIWKKDWKQILRIAIPTAAALFVAIALPRLLIQVQGSMQFVNSDSGMMRTVKYFLSPKRNLNLIYDSIAYFLPVWILATKERFQKLKSTGDFFQYLLCYIFFVLLLCYGGGGDLMRFVTFYSVAVILIAVFFMQDAKAGEIVVTLVAVFIFNRIWMQVPMDSLDKYLDLLAGHNTRINMHSLYRVLELIGLIAVGRMINQRLRKSDQPAMA